MPNENAINRRRKHIAELERAIERHKKTRAGWEHDATLAEALVILARLQFSQTPISKASRFSRHLSLLSFMVATLLEVERYMQRNWERAP